MGIKLYHAISSPPSRSVILLMKVLNIPYEEVQLDLAKGEHLKAEFTEVNPRRTVPTLVDNGFSICDRCTFSNSLFNDAQHHGNPSPFRMFNKSTSSFINFTARIEIEILNPKQIIAEASHLFSHSINSYLVNKYAKDDKLYPKDTETRCIVDQGLYFDAGTLFPRFLYTTKAIFSKTISKIDDDTALNFARLYQSLDRSLKGKLFIAGKNLTIADFSIITTLTAMNILVPIEIDFQTLPAYVERCKLGIPNYMEVMRDAQEAYTQRLLSAGFSLKRKKY